MQSVQVRLCQRFSEEADELRRRGGDGGEYGATTGRPGGWDGLTVWLLSTAAVSGTTDA